MICKPTTHVLFGNKSDVVTTTFTLQPENDTERAIINAVYGLKGRILTCNNTVYVELNRHVEHKEQK